MIIGIFAIDEKGGLGRNGSMPWKCKEDMQWFKSITTNNIVVMGRKTWESTGYLPNRKNVIITTQELTALNKDVEIIAKNINNSIVALQKYNNTKDVFVIGGAKVLLQTKPILEQLFITRIPGDYDCDVVIDLPEFLTEFTLTKCMNLNTCIVETYERIHKSPRAYTS